MIRHRNRATSGEPDGKLQFSHITLEYRLVLICNRDLGHRPPEPTQKSSLFG